MRHKFNEWKQANRHVFHKVHGYADLGYLAATLAELHSVHLIAVAVLFSVTAVHVLIIGDVE